MTYKALTTDSLRAQGIVDNLVADAIALGWSRVESYHVEGILTYDVLKCPGSLNYFGRDFHVAIGFNTDSKDSLAISLFEEWNTSSKMATAYCPATNSATVTASYTVNASPARLNSGFPVPSSRSMYMVTAGGIAPTENYWYSVSPDRITLAVAVNSTNNFARFAGYVGGYERFLPSSLDPCPVVISRFSGQGYTGTGVAAANSARGAATREPGQVGITTENFAAGFYIDDSTAGYAGELWTPVGIGNTFGRKNLDSVNELYSNRPFVSRVPVIGRQANGVRGLFIGLYGVGAGIQPAGTVATWTFAGNTYTATRMRGDGAGTVQSILHMEQL
jgi:hypothetical protein